jgi:threonine-phosphate decarboxylase
MYTHGGDIYSIGKDVIDFSANINFMGMPKSVFEAAHRGVDMSVNYPQPMNMRLAQRITDYYKDNGMFKDMDSDNFLIGNGAAELIFNFIQEIKPKRAVVPAPTFYEYENALKRVNKNIDIRRYALDEEKDFIPDEEIFESIGYKTDIVCLCNPNNPTGKLTDKRLIFEIIEKCRETGAWLFIDESFMEMVENGRGISFVNDMEEVNYDKIFILKSFTKLFAMPGLRLGYGICKDKQTADIIRKSHQPWNISLPAQEAGMAAMDELQYNRYDETAAAVIKEERERLCENLSNLSRIKCYKGEANFVLFRYLAENTFTRAEDTLEKRLLQDALQIRNCENFIGLSRGWYRVSVRSRQENERLVGRIAQYLD